MPYAPSLTIEPDVNPCPRVLVSFTSLAGTAQVINVYRVAEGRQMTVRGGVNLFAVGGAAVMDYEAPIAVSMTYRAEMFDSSGISLGFTDASSTIIPPAMVLTDPVNGVWIHQPLKPSLAIQARMLKGTASQITRTNPGDTFYPQGATVGIRIGGRRLGITGMPMGILVDSDDDADTFQSMFGGYTSDFPAVICVRTSTAVRIPRVLFATADPQEVKVAGYVTFQMSLDEVAPPAPGLVLPTLRRADIDAAFTTRAARAAAYATRLARDTDYTKAGLAG